MIVKQKPCYRCERTLPASEFLRDGRTKTGLQANCRACREEMIIPVSEKRCSRCSRMKDAASFCKGQASDGLYVWCKECTRLYKIEQRYRLTPEQFHELAKGGCNICGSFDRLAVDHDHTCCPGTGKITCGKCVRGVLCRQHNQGLGNFQDDPEMLQAAIDYLRR